MNVSALLNALFPDGHQVREEGDLLVGTGSVATATRRPSAPRQEPMREEGDLPAGTDNGTTVAVIGTANHAAIGVELALALAGEVLEVLRQHPRRPILLLVDTQGQRLRHRDELLAINAYMAHLAKCLEVARQAGHRVVSLVYGRAVSGGYISGGMMADACFALASASISVMNLPAMARVTKIAQDKLEALAESSPVFAPGADNYFKMGALDDVWSGDLAEALRQAFEGQGMDDRRKIQGSERGGRTMALAVANRVRHDAAP